MAKFLVVHPVGNELTVEGATPIGKAVKAVATTDAYWLRSWYAREEGKLYCEWDAKDAEAVRQVISKAATDVPVEGVYRMELMVHSEDFR
ncbi:MAG: nickel-binding protein [bacterium]